LVDVGEGSERPDVSLSYDWQQARYLLNGVSPLACRTAEGFYIPAAELNAHHAAPGLRTATTNEFANWHPHGKPITLPAA
jgi:hypothetical protein